MTTKRTDDGKEGREGKTGLNGYKYRRGSSAAPLAVIARGALVSTGVLEAERAEGTRSLPFGSADEGTGGALARVSSTIGFSGS